MLLALSTWSGCGPSESSYFRQVTRLSGPGAVDCGKGTVEADQRPVLACMEKALAAGDPFRATVEMYGLENVITLSIVRQGTGDPVAVIRDPDACNHNCWAQCT